jgi:serine/threonine protein kinase
MGPFFVVIAETIQLGFVGVRQPVPFGKYLLLDRISVGGMAEVFKAKSYGVEGFEKIIAIKRILPTMGEDRDFIKMFIDEAKIAGQLAHANICQIFELGRIDGSHFIAMEYIWGKDLLQIQNRLRKIKQPMPIAMACFTIAKVLEGLDYAHRKRDPLGRPLEIVHRDCSPQNVLVSYEGEVKVIDFGIAKATSRNSRTMAGVLKGKFGYMSPEQVRGLPLDRRSDIFALGTMLYECLTGDRLFQGETDFSTLEKVRNVDIRAPREINPNIPESVEKVILKALAKDVDDRYQWCSEMLADLQQFLMSQDVVFTAKSLSGWLKEVFQSEIERERQQLEQYKRVGRDGLIAGAPAAQAKVDLVETLGEAGAPEGDATQLGGPDFEALEALVKASAQPQLAASRSQAVAPETVELDDEESNEFGEEAPTEIFGELDTSKPGSPQLPIGVARPSAPQPAARPSPASSQPPMNRPPPMRPPTASQPPQQYASGVSGPGARTMIAPPNNATMTVSDDQIVSPQNQADARAAFAQQFPGLAQPSPSQGYPQQQQQYPNGHIAHGTPGAMPSQPMAAMQPPGQGRTLMGAAPPPGVPNYSQGYPQHLSNPQMPVQNPQMMGGYPQNMYGNPSNPQMPAMNPSSPHMNAMNPYAQPYGSQPSYAQPSTPLMETAHVSHLPANEGKRKSSIGRDVAIGVAIAAVVLGGFLAVKFLVLDSGDSKETPSTIATIRIAMPEGTTAELYVDEVKAAQAVKNNSEVPVNAGQRKIKLIGPNGTRCEKPMSLAAGKITTVECIMPSDGSAATPASGSGSATSASTQPATGSGSDTLTQPATGSGSQVATADKAAADKAAADKAAADKAAADKAAADKAAEAQAAKDKAAAEKAAADKAAKDKLAAKDKDSSSSSKPKDKDSSLSSKPKDRMPVEENPIDRIAAQPSKGYVKIVAPKDAQTLVDGAAPSGSLTKLPLSPGKHKVQFIIGSDKHSFSVMVKAGETITLDKHDLQ